MEVVIPIEIGLLMVKTTMQESKANEGNLKVHLDWVDERKVAIVRLTSYQQRTMTHYNKRVHPRLFRQGDMVLRRFFESTAERGTDKLQPNWEEPYIVHKIGRVGAYHLQTLDKTPLLRPWNVANLKK